MTQHVKAGFGDLVTLRAPKLWICTEVTTQGCVGRRFKVSKRFEDL
jgi:hypothetical protein